MASEEDLAAYLEQVLPRLVEVGAPGAMIWCFADYRRSCTSAALRREPA